MRKVSRKTQCNAIYRQLSDICLSGHERQSAAQALHQAEAIVGAAVWVKDRIASVGASLPRLRFKH